MAAHRFAHPIARLTRVLSAAFLLFAATAAPAAAAGLPQEHRYQRTLRDFLATLAERDFVIETSAQPPRAQLTLDDAYRDWIWTRNDIALPLGGVALPAGVFTLQAIESPAGVMRPNANPGEMARLAMWDHPGNLFYNSPGLRRRAMAVAILDMVMLDDLHEKRPDAGANRSDFLGGTLIWLAYSYPSFRSLLSPEAQRAYEDGLRKLIARLGNWGPRGSMTDMDLFAPVGLAYAAKALDDRVLERVARQYSQPLFTDPRFFRPAGYFVDGGCFDTSYNGISLFFATWTARLVDWPFAHDAVDRAFKLRSHLCLPEPESATALSSTRFVGPSHMSSRTSGDPPHDQWNWVPRNIGAAMTTDHALWMAPIPSEEDVRAAPAAVTAAIKAAADAMRQPPAVDPAKPPPPASLPWAESHWAYVNFTADHYTPGLYDRLRKLQAEKSPLLKPPFLREKNFIENFDDTLLVAKFERFGVVIHTGPVASDDARWKRPRGFGGGAISAFWTPQAGPALLGRRRGIQGRTFDTYDDWRLWPTHAITGLTASGRPISSARTLQPLAKYEVGEDRATIRVTGTFNPLAGAAAAKAKEAGLTSSAAATAPASTAPATRPAEPVLRGTIDYARKFEVTPAGLHVESSARGDGRDPLTELYEVIPVYLNDGTPPDPAAKWPDVELSFQVGGAWRAGTPEPMSNVAAVRVNRAFGSIIIELDRPRTVRISPEVWVDGYMSTSNCRNVMIDLLEKPRTLDAAGVVVSYRITPTERAK